MKWGTDLRTHRKFPVGNVRDSVPPGQVPDCGPGPRRPLSVSVEGRDGDERGRDRVPIHRRCSVHLCICSLYYREGALIGRFHLLCLHRLLLVPGLFTVLSLSHFTYYRTPTLPQTFVLQPLPKRLLPSKFDSVPTLPRTLSPGRYTSRTSTLPCSTASPLALPHLSPVSCVPRHLVPVLGPKIRFPSTFCASPKFTSSPY